jgi:hypothetical protein
LITKLAPKAAPKKPAGTNPVRQEIPPWKIAGGRLATVKRLSQAPGAPSRLAIRQRLWRNQLIFRLKL